MIRWAHVEPVVRAGLLDLRRRRDFAVAGGLLGALVLLLAGGRVMGVEDPATGTFLLNLGLSLAAGAAQVLTLVLAARPFPEEMENRTLYPLLARPVGRTEILLGKWGCCLLAGVGMYAVLTGAVFLLAPRMEFYDPRTGVQMVALQGLALATVASWTMAISLVLPRGLALLVSGGVAFAAGPVMRWGGGICPVRLLPEPARLNLVLRYTDGMGSLSLGELSRLAAGAGLWIVLGLAAGSWLLRRKSL